LEISSRQRIAYLNSFFSLSFFFKTVFCIKIQIIRDTNGDSKGCAVLKFRDKSSALRAISELHQKVSLITVSFMETCIFWSPSSCILIKSNMNPHDTI
jgi:RNA recognition motif-containing protein